MYHNEKRYRDDMIFPQGVYGLLCSCAKCGNVFVLYKSLKWPNKCYKCGYNIFDDVQLEFNLDDGEEEEK